MAARQCGATTHHGRECRTDKLPGFPNCLRHLPEDLCDLAAEMGYYRCTARVTTEWSERAGERCGNAAIHDNEYCAYHFPDQKALVPFKKDEYAKIYKIHKVALDAGIDTTTVANPLQALLELAAEAMAFKNEMQMRVKALHADEWRYEGMAGEQIRGEITLYEKAIDRVTRNLVTIARLGIEERIARVEETKARMIEKAVTAALEESGATPDMQDRAREAIVRRLRAVE